jgi:hypothetical protein
MRAKIAFVFDLQSLLSPQSSLLADGVILRRRLFFWASMKAHKTGFASILQR